MNKDNDFEIIDDFDDLTVEPSSNPVVSNEVPSNEVINRNSEVEIPSFSFGEIETPEVTKEEPVTFEFDGFEGVLDNQEITQQPSSKEENISLEMQQVNQEPIVQENQEIEPMIHPAEPLAAPGTVDVMPSTPTLNMDVEPVPTIQQNEEQPVEINPVLPNGEPVTTPKEVSSQKEKVENSNDKKGGNVTKLAFIIILFLIIGAVILFLPQISSILKEIGI